MYEIRNRFSFSPHLKHVSFQTQRERAADTRTQLSNHQLFSSNTSLSGVHVIVFRLLQFELCETDIYHPCAPASFSVCVLLCKLALTAQEQ